MSAAPAPFGFINAFKPPGPSSTAFGLWVRRRVGARSLGHWGTLDPAACGVLVLAIGRATRLLPYFASDEKSYVFEMRVGAYTDTGDATGRVVRTSAVPADWASKLLTTVPSLIGPLEQTPPMFSAVKIDGRPLYKAARAGRDVPRPARRVEIRSLRVIESSGDCARLRVDCSAGTYVRTLCEQIGERIGVAAHLGMLLRTRAGPFALDSASTPDEIDLDPVACLVDPVPALGLATVEIGDEDAARFLHGNDVSLAPPEHAGASQVLVLHAGVLIGVGRWRAALEPVRVLRAGKEN